MRRRQYVTGVGISLAAGSTLFRENVQALNIDTDNGTESVDQIISDTYETSGLATALSQTGDVILYGFDDGNVMVYDDERDGEVLDLDIDQRVTHILVTEEPDTAVLGWMDANTYGLHTLSTGEESVLQHQGLWDIDATPDTERMVSVSSPTEGPGSVLLGNNNGEVVWETSFDDAAGHSVAITDDGEHAAVGAATYTDADGNFVGTPGVKLYTGEGTEQWAYETAEDVLSVNINGDRELVVGGTNDGKTIVLDFGGNLVWETEEYGGWVFLSYDGSTIVTSARGGILAVSAEDGAEQWFTDDVPPAFDDMSVSNTGSHVITARRGEGGVFVIDQGDVIWEKNYDVGPAVGQISGDGSTWSISIQNNDDESGPVEAYKLPDPAAAITVVDTELSTTEIKIEDSVDVDVTLENAGDADDAHTVQLLVDDRVEDETNVDVEASGSATVTFSHVFEKRGEYEIAINGATVGIVEVIDPNIRTVVDFDWNYPDCPDEEVGELQQYFFGDHGSDGFHIDDGGGASEEPDGCVLRTDGDEVEIISLPNGHDDQSDSLDHYPGRGETILFGHYIHREGANMEFDFGVQDDVESRYSVRLATESEMPTLSLVRVDDGTATILDQISVTGYSSGKFHDVVIAWEDTEITVILSHVEEEIAISASDEAYDHGGIRFYKENTGLIRSYAHLWNRVEIQL